MKMSRSSSSLFMQQKQRPDATTLAGAAGDKDDFMQQKQRPDATTLAGAAGDEDEDAGG